MTDEKFMAWCEMEKQCRYCRGSFVGPVCPCERECERRRLFNPKPGNRQPRASGEE